MAEEKKMIIDGVSCPFTTERNVLVQDQTQNQQKHSRKKKNQKQGRKNLFILHESTIPP